MGFKESLTQWVDERVDKAVKTAVAEAKTDLAFYLDERFGKLEKGIDDTGTMISGVSRDVGTVTDSMTKLFESVVAIPQNIVDQLAKFNPFHLP